MAEPRCYRVESVDANEMHDERPSRILEGEFDCAEDAAACARRVVARSLRDEFSAAASASDAQKGYRLYGAIPFIWGEPPVPFDLAATVDEEVTALYRSSP